MVEDGPAAIRKPRLFLSLTEFLSYPLPCSPLQVRTKTLSTLHLLRKEKFQKQLVPSISVSGEE